MTSYYRLIIGGSELALDAGEQWTDDDLHDMLRMSEPQVLPLAGGGAVSFVPGPGVAVVREEASGRQVF